MWLINLTSSQNENKFVLPSLCSLRVLSCSEFLYADFFFLLNFSLERVSVLSVLLGCLLIGRDKSL